MKKVVIIGANESINCLIKKAKEKGYETHVFSWAAGEPGEKEADYFYPISVADKERILEISRQIKPCGIASITSDFAVNTVNYVARELGLTCNNIRVEQVARNKSLMRDALRNAGLYTPRYLEVSAKTEVDSSSFRFPVIVKPVDRWSSKGVTRVDTPQMLSAAIQTAFSESLSGNAIVEEYIEGPEYSCECISFAGEHHLLAYTAKATTGYPNYIETGHTQPAKIPNELKEVLSGQIKQAISALSIENGASHVEFKIIDSDKLAVIEIGARMGGDCIGTDLVPLSTGYDYVGMVLDVACGNAPDFKKISKPMTASVRFILAHEDLQMLSRDRERGVVIRESAMEEIDDRKITDSSSRFGYYIYIGE